MNESNQDLVEKFMRLGPLFHNYSMHAFRNFGPSATPYRGQGRVLSILKLQPEISQKELGYLLDMSKQSLAELLNKLEHSGYIVRTPSEEDRRVTNIRLTEAGAATTVDVEDQRSDIDKLFDCFNSEEHTILSGHLARLIAELEKQLPGHDDIKGHPKDHSFHP
jgi:DNA-binding MarR family transcriptional regulator